MKYTITEGQQGEKILTINGLQSVCPFVNAIPFQGNMGQVQIMRMPCSTLCPHAVLKDTQYKMTCGSDIHILRLEAEEKKETPIISL
jgi:hypothetical protein